MSFASVRTEVERILLSATGIGRVHTYRRLTKFWIDYYKRHVKDMRVNNWEISRGNVTENIDDAGGLGNNPFYRVISQVIITGHMSVGDENESEKDFQDLIDNILTKFRSEITGSGFYNGVLILPKSLQVPIIEHRNFGSVFCHFCQMTLEAHERVQGV